MSWQGQDKELACRKSTSPQPHDTKTADRGANGVVRTLEPQAEGFYIARTQLLPLLYGVRSVLDEVQEWQMTTP